MFSEKYGADQEHDGVVDRHQRGDGNPPIMGNNETDSCGAADHQSCRQNKGADTDGHEDVSDEHQKDVHCLPEELHIRHSDLLEIKIGRCYKIILHIFPGLCNEISP